MRLPLLLGLFAISGAAALAYELVWFQLLRLAVGGSSISLAIVLSSFMAGLCVGSLGFSRWVPNTRAPLWVWGLIEAGIGLAGLFTYLAIPWVGELYIAVVGYGALGIALRAFVCLLLLLPGTVLIGATLPAMARSLETSREGVSWMGFFYAANIAGGLIGCLGTGFYLLPAHDLWTATLCAVAANGLVAGVAVALGTNDPLPTSSGEASAPSRVNASRDVFAVIAISGAAALAAQVVWTRLLALVFGATVFSFTVILAVVLTGMGLGSALASAAVRIVSNPRRALGVVQLGLAAALPYAAYVVSAELPFWRVNPELAADATTRYAHDLLRGMVALLPATMLFGASFPLALAAAAEHETDPARLAGRVTAANTAGAIIGALFTATLGIPVLGTTGTQQLVLLATSAAGLALLFPWSRSLAAPAQAIAAVGLLGVAMLLAASVGPVSAGLVAYGHDVDRRLDVDSYLFVEEGRTSSVAVTQGLEPGRRGIHVGGKVVASTDPNDFRLQRMLGHLPALFHPYPKTALVVGFGSGITAGALTLHPTIERIVICEIEPVVAEAAAAHFAEPNYRVLDDPRVELVFDDARHYMATSDEQFDIITADPIHPYVDGAAALFSREYYAAARERLAKGGLMAQWVPVYDTDIPTVKSEVATFMESFPDGTLWSSHVPSLGGNDLVMIGGNEPITLRSSALASRVGAIDAVSESLEEVDLGYTVSLMAAYMGRASDLADWLADAEINHEGSLRLQYLAGRAYERHEGIRIYQDLSSARVFPDDLLLVGSRQRAEIENRWRLDVRNAFAR